jgi:hypothetical protein
MNLGRLLVWMESSDLAGVVRNSTVITGVLSAIHLIGMTVLLGAATVANLRVVGIAFADRPIAEVARAARLKISMGLAVSVSTGLLLFAPRATDAAVSEPFRQKMFLLALAAVFHAALYRSLLERPTRDVRLIRVFALLSLMLWSSVAVAGVAYILLE